MRLHKRSEFSATEVFVHLLPFLKTQGLPFKVCPLPFTLFACLFVGFEFLLDGAEALYQLRISSVKFSEFFP